MPSEALDAVVVGAGPNGLAAAIRLAQGGRSVLVLEANRRPGGGLRTEELLEPGFRHDICSTVMAMDDLVADAMGPLKALRHPLLLGRLGMPGLLPASALARVLFHERDTRALMAGAAAHSMLALSEPGTAAFALVLLVTAHAGGWPLARGGSQFVADTLVARLEHMGGEVRCGERVTSLDHVPEHRAALLDLVPEGVLEVAGDRLTPTYRRRLQRYRHGSGVFKVDWTLDGPIPWRAPACARAATVHLGGSLEEIARSEHEVAGGRPPERPFVILVQPTLFDPTRAPDGKHVASACCHVPNGCDQDLTKAVEDQVERFAPGFRDVARQRRTWTPAQLQAEQPNCVGGDIGGGRMDLGQLFTRPVARLDPYRTSHPAIFICSAATPPAGGIHGLCGWHAARSALRSVLGE